MSLHGLKIGSRLFSMLPRWRDKCSRTTTSTDAANPYGVKLEVTRLDLVSMDPELNLIAVERKPRIEKSRMIPVWWVHHKMDSRPFGSWEDAMSYVRELRRHD